MKNEQPAQERHIANLMAEREATIRLIAEHFTGPHDSLEDYVRNLLQSYISCRDVIRELENELSLLRTQLAETKKTLLALQVHMM